MTVIAVAPPIKDITLLNETVLIGIDPNPLCFEISKGSSSITQVDNDALK